MMLRAPRASEAATLSALALRSKAYWGYDREFLEACRAELTWTAFDLSENQFRVAEHRGDVCGFYALSASGPAEIELEALFVEPGRIGTGVGRVLMLHALRQCAAAGARRLVIQGDPHAERFYLRAGGERVGERESGSIPGRVLPLYSITIDKHSTDETTPMLRVYGDGRSGNCYKIQLLLSWIDTDYEWVEVDIMAGATRTPEFASMNSNAKIPVLEYAPGKFLAESNAILHYLADGTEFLPEDRLARAEILQWQFFEQYSHEPCIAVARFIAKYLGLPEARRADYESRQPGGHKALGIMERHLARAPYFVNRVPTIADISLFAYTHVAHEGGFDLGGYPAVRDWISRIQRLPRHVPMADVPGPASAG